MAADYLPKLHFAARERASVLEAFGPLAHQTAYWSWKRPSSNSSTLRAQLHIDGPPRKTGYFKIRKQVLFSTVLNLIIPETGVGFHLHGLKRWLEFSHLGDRPVTPIGNPEAWACS
jgi:hypothetical protein